MKHTQTCGCDCQPGVFTHKIEHAGLEFSRRKFVKNVSSAGGGVLLASGIAPGLLSSCSRSSTGDVDSVNYSGPIDTITEDGNRMEALAIMEGKYISAGFEKDILKLKVSVTSLIDFGGQCLMYEFIYPHSQVILRTAKYFSSNLSLIRIESFTLK